MTECDCLTTVIYYPIIHHIFFSFLLWDIYSISNNYIQTTIYRQLYTDNYIQTTIYRQLYPHLVW